MEIGRRIFYEIKTGNVIIDTGERNGFVIPTTIEQDIKSFSILSERNRETFDVLELPYGAYTRDFATAKSYRVNLNTKKLEFSYAPPSDPTVPPFVMPSLTEKIEELEALWFYDSMMKDLAIEEANAMQADLMYQLMLKGVI